MCPKIPTYNAQLGLTKQAPAIRTDPNAAGMQARAVGGVGEVISKLGEHFDNLQKEEEMRSSIAEFHRASNEEVYNASIEEYSDDYEDRHIKNLQNIKKSALSNIKHREVASELNARLDMQLSNAEINIRKFGRDKLIEKSTVTLDTNVMNYVQEYISSDSSQKETILSKIGEEYSSAAQRGLMKADVANRAFLDIKAELPERQAAFDATNNPEQYFANRGKYGIAADKLADSDKIAEKTIKELDVYNAQQKFAAQQGFNESLEGKRVDMALEELDNGVFSQLYDKDWADSKKNAILSSVDVNPDKMNEFEYEIINDVASIKTGFDSAKEKKSVKNAKEYLMNLQDIEIKLNNGIARGLINKTAAREQLKSIYNLTAEATQKVVDRGWPWSYTVKDADEAFKEVMPAGDRFEAVREFFYETEGKKLGYEEHKTIADNIIKKYQTKNNPQYQTWEEGKIYPTPQGDVKVIGFYPDGEPNVELVVKEKANATK